MTEIETGTDHLLGRIDEGVAILTLNRPERRNALSRDMLDALARVLGDVEADEDVGCVVWRPKSSGGRSGWRGVPGSRTGT